MTEELHWVEGGCHCGAVSFEVEVPSSVTVHRCNCSICSATGFVHLIVPARRFRLNSAQTALTKYTFNTRTAQHLFCKKCGVKSFYIPRSNPDGYSVNINCVDRSKISKIEIEDFDGQNWEANAAGLAHLSVEE